MKLGTSFKPTWQWKQYTHNMNEAQKCRTLKVLLHHKTSDISIFIGSAPLGGGIKYTCKLKAWSTIGKELLDVYIFISNSLLVSSFSQFSLVISLYPVLGIWYVRKSYKEIHAGQGTFAWVYTNVHIGSRLSISTHRGEKRLEREVCTVNATSRSRDRDEVRGNTKVRWGKDREFCRFA